MSQISGFEERVFEWLTECGKVEWIRNSRQVIAPYELDFYAPDLKIAIELNGCYWHSEKFKPRTYHYEKWKRCREAGIQLIQIWEDTWVKRPHCVQSLLRNKLHLSDSLRINARDCEVSSLDYQTAAAFLDANHVQGSKQATAYLGLTHHDELVAVMLLTKQTEDTWTLDRFATSALIRGGFSKLLSHARQHIPYEVARLVTFAHHDVSDGGLYERTGWKKDAELPADYSYLVDGERQHKFNFRKSRFQRDPNLVFDATLTETQLASLNGLSRCWDSGKTRYTLELHD